ncbi:Uncharacterised protein [uncultured archaeon]|nr:Uncharacterised protein [uncultured archaeon]
MASHERKPCQINDLSFFFYLYTTYINFIQSKMAKIRPSLTVSALNKSHRGECFESYQNFIVLDIKRLEKSDIINLVDIVMKNQYSISDCFK